MAIGTVGVFLGFTFLWAFLDKTFALGFPIHFDWSWRTLFNKQWEDALFAANGGSKPSKDSLFYKKGKFAVEFVHTESAKEQLDGLAAGTEELPSLTRLRRSFGPRP